MQEAIKKGVSDFLERSKDKNIKIISHHDTDGITSAAIFSKTLQKLDKKFSIQIVKQLEKEFINTLKNEEFVVFLDLGSSSLQDISKLKNALVLDHHEITSEVPENIIFINPLLFGEEEISGAGITYLFAKEIDKENIALANLAVIGMVGDMLGRSLSKTSNSILNDAEVLVKKSLLLYPATRPIHKALEFSSSMFIPGVTGNSKGVYNLLREAGIKKENGEYKSLIELSEEELSKIITAILLRRSDKENSMIIGNIYLIKFFNKLEDARELSAIINACSRLSYPDIAILLCLGNKKARKSAEKIYANYKQHLISAINFANENKIEKKGYIIINAKDNIKDSIIGTVASIISSSSIHEEGTIIIAMAYDGDKIKISARVAGRKGRNVRQILESVINRVGGECGGHPLAAGCITPKSKEKEFINQLEKELEIELVKV